MNDPTSSELRELMTKLSDGTLTSDETERLNSLLKADSVSQAMYLDAMLIDGLLEREFSGGGTPHAAAATGGVPEAYVSPSRTTRSSRFRLRGRIVVSALMTLLIVVSWFAWAPLAGQPQRRPLQLADSGFENGTLTAPGAVPETVWQGDVADVVGNYANVIPVEGSRMLRFVRSTVEPEDVCELYQVVDLRGATEGISRQPMSVEASAFFNAIPEEMRENNHAFGITVFAFSEDPTKHPRTSLERWGRALSFGGSQAQADTDTKSWQKVTTRLPLPPDTKYLVVQIAVIDTDGDQEIGEFRQQFADNVALNLVSVR